MTAGKDHRTYDLAQSILNEEIENESWFSEFLGEGPSSSLSRISLLILAITIHNFPEGLAVGVSFGSGDITAGIVIAIAIGLQNIPKVLRLPSPWSEKASAEKRRYSMQL